jgi:hypothetical protein
VSFKATGLIPADTMAASRHAGGGEK